MKKIIVMIALLFACVATASAGRFMGLGFFKDAGEIIRTAFSVTDNGGEAFRVTDNGGEDFNVR